MGDGDSDDCRDYLQLVRSNLDIGWFRFSRNPDEINLSPFGAKWTPQLDNAANQAGIPSRPVENLHSVSGLDCGKCLIVHWKPPFQAVTTVAQRELPEVEYT
jgi:hypothetical protein